MVLFNFLKAIVCLKPYPPQISNEWVEWAFTSANGTTLLIFNCDPFCREYLQYSSLQDITLRQTHILAI